MQYKRTKEVVKERLQTSSKEPTEVMANTEVGKIIGYRNFLIDDFVDDRKHFFITSETDPIEVFKYLPDEMLDELIKYFDGNDYYFRKEKAIEALERSG